MSDFEGVNGDSAVPTRGAGACRRFEDCLYDENRVWMATPTRQRLSRLAAQTASTTTRHSRRATHAARRHGCRRRPPRGGVREAALPPAPRELPRPLSTFKRSRRFPRCEVIDAAVVPDRCDAGGVHDATGGFGSLLSGYATAPCSCGRGEGRSLARSASGRGRATRAECGAESFARAAACGPNGTVYVCTVWHA